MLLKTDSSVRFSAVVPCYNEEGSLNELARRLSAVCSRAFGESYEIILVNDGSRDGTWPLMTALSREHRQIVSIDLSRNHGHQLALSAGLAMARGEIILVMDADLQHPPEVVPAMLQMLEDQGADVVYGQPASKPSASAFKKFTARLFYRILTRLSETPIPEDAGDFRLIRRRVLDVLLEMPEHYRFIRGMIAWIGFVQVPFVYDQSPRTAGVTKYSVRKMVTFGLDAITGFSIAPLRFSLLLSVGFGLLSMLLGVYTIIAWLLYDTVRGWTSLLLTMSVFSSVQLFALSIMGEYIGRTYMQTKSRPLFVIREIVGGSR